MALLRHGAGRPESFYLSQESPPTIGYKFGPLQPEVLTLPSVLQQQLTDRIEMARCSARVVALECQSTLARAELDPPKPEVDESQQSTSFAERLRRKAQDAQEQSIVRD